MDKRQMLQQLVIDEAGVFEKLVERSKPYLKVDKQGGVVFLVPRSKLTDRQAVALTLLGRYFATELGFVESEVMTADEILPLVDAEKTVVAARLNDLKGDGIVESPTRGKFKINWMKVLRILDELDSKQ